MNTDDSSTSNDESRHASNQQSGSSSVLPQSEVEEGEHSTTNATNTSDKRKKRRINEFDPAAFDRYLSSIDKLIKQTLEDSASDRLSSLLKKDFPALLVSKDAAEIATLATKLRKVPNLSTEKIKMLNLMEEIPKISDEFQSCKAVIEEANRFFSTLEHNKAKSALLRTEYYELSNELESVEMKVVKKSEAIGRIDEQMAMLLAEKNELMSALENEKKDEAELRNGQCMKAGTILSVVNMIQESNSKIDEWEHKKNIALKLEEDILSKVAPLKDFFSL